MASLSDLLKKIANNAKLTPQELDELGRFGTETQQRNAFVAENITAQNSLNITFPFYPIYSEVLQSDTASVDIVVPQNTKNLFVVINGRITAATTADFVLARFNNDSGSNYRWAYEGANGTTQTAQQGSGTSYLILGDLSGTSIADNYAGSVIAWILNCKSNLYKTVICNQTVSIWDGGGNTFTAMESGTWMSTATINTVKIYPALGNFLAGTNISIYSMI
jgi:hypothetical protein